MLVIAIFIMFLIISLNFNSVYQSFIIIAVLPAGIFGSMLGHGIEGLPVRRHRLAAQKSLEAGQRRHRLPLPPHPDSPGRRDVPAQGRLGPEPDFAGI